MVRGTDSPQLYLCRGVSGYLLPTVARMVFESFAHVPVTEELLRHVWEGEQDQTKGGHRFGLGRERKSEFPEDWDLSMVNLAIDSVLNSPQLISDRVSSIDCVRQVGGVIVLVKLVRTSAGLRISTCYPVCGDGVYRNVRGLKMKLPLDLSVLEA